MRSKRNHHRPDTCDLCHGWITYWDDGYDGIWAECDCTAGYIT